MYNVKKKLNSLLSLFLLITLLCAPLTGCNGANIPEDSQNPIQTETESESGTTETTTGSEDPSDSQRPTQSETPGDSQEPTESQKPSQSEDPGTSENPGTSQDPTEPENPGTQTGTTMDTPGISLSDIPAYNGTHYIVLNNNIPHFATNNLSTEAFEHYSELDSLGRCGVAYACLGKETMPADGEKRGSISSVKPTGWIQKKYDTSIVKTGDIYNRSHLIAWSLSAENANKLNLITGTPQLNQTNMTEFEDMVYDYLHECIDNNISAHVMYRVTPFFEGKNLVATGVQMEAWSIEDNGESICFNVFIYNAQDGVIIDYATGESRAENETESTEPDNSETVTPGTGTGSGEVSREDALYMVNKKNGKIHKIDCASVDQTGENNRVFFATWEEALAYSKEVASSMSNIECGICHAYSEHNN